MKEEVKLYIEPGKYNIFFVYCLMLISLIAPIWGLIAGVFAYAYQSCEDENIKSHYIFAFRNWLILFAAYLTMKLLYTFADYYGDSFYIVLRAVQLAIFLYLVVRSILALKYLVVNQPHPDPLTWKI